MPSLLRSSFSLCAAAILACPPSFAFQSPLSEEAVREAYFLGERRDGTSARFLAEYTQQLPTPKTGPYVSSVTFLTPFAMVVQQSGRTINYDAQQAELDHRSRPEVVQVTVQIQLTETYGWVLPQPVNSDSSSPGGLRLRSTDFWKDFAVQALTPVRDDNQEEQMEPIAPLTSSGEPTYSCSDDGCNLSGALLYFEFPAEAFTSDSATIQVTPPEGEQASVDFDLVKLR